MLHALNDNIFSCTLAYVITITCVECIWAIRVILYAQLIILCYVLKPGAFMSKSNERKHGNVQRYVVLDFKFALLIPF